MENNICAVCKSPMRLVPAGISKRTGQAYEAFWACPQKCVQPKNTNYVGKPNKQDQIKQAMEVKQKNIEKSIDRKEESIDCWASINNATILVAEMLRGGDVFKNDKEIATKIKSLAEGIRDVAQEMKKENIFKQDIPAKGYERQSEVVEAEEEVNEQLSQIQY
jgi:hypothetical protein